MPSNVAQNALSGKLPAIALTAEDHAETDSFREKQNRKPVSFLPDSPKSDTYRNESAKMIDNGRYAELVTDEVYNIKDKFGDKYDGALSEYLDSTIDYIRENGVPEPVYSKKYHQEENVVKEVESKTTKSVADKTTERRPAEMVDGVDSPKTEKREENDVKETAEKANESSIYLKPDSKVDKAYKTDGSHEKDKEKETDKTTERRIKRQKRRLIL